MRERKIGRRCGGCLGSGTTADHLACLIFGAFIMTGCSGAKVTTQVSNDLPRYQVKTIALVPFSAMATPQLRDSGDRHLSTPESIRRSDMSLAVPSGMEQQLRQTFTVPDHAAEKITQLFWNRLRNRKDIVALSPGETVKIADSKSEVRASATPEAMGAALAKKVNAEVAIIGRVSIYQERVGSRAGADPPAAVGFEVKAVSTDGRVLWIGNYYERQQPMTEDLMGFFRRRGAFVTAEELARYGVDEVMKAFPFGTAEK